MCTQNTQIDKHANTRTHTHIKSTFSAVIYFDLSDISHMCHLCIVLFPSLSCFPSKASIVTVLHQISPLTWYYLRVWKVHLMPAGLVICEEVIFFNSGVYVGPWHHGRLGHRNTIYCYLNDSSKATLWNNDNGKVLVYVSRRGDQQVKVTNGPIWII